MRILCWSSDVCASDLGAFPCAPVQPAAMTAFACYDLENVKVVGYDVVSNRPKVAAYRANGAPISAFGVESALDDLARSLDMDPTALRDKNAAADSPQTAYVPNPPVLSLHHTPDDATDQPTNPQNTS